MFSSDFRLKIKTGSRKTRNIKTFTNIEFGTSLGMRVFTMATLICLSAISFAAGGLVPVRLVGGPSLYEGRLEVYYNSTWGTVCDDQMSDDNCAVVCKQLGYQGGQYIANAVGHYGKGTGITWLDDLNCSGSEPDLDACLHRFWGDEDCSHDEDTGCKCSPPADPSSVVVVLPPAGTCENHRHRIRAFDPMYPGIGRAEILGNDGSWYVICDDYWDDVDAAVFCHCLGYTDETHFRAYWSRDLVKMEPAMSTLYGGVHCTVAEMNIIQNIWQCRTDPSIGSCDGTVEAAAVACQALPPVTPPGPPAAHLDCDGNTLTVCYTSVDYSLEAQYMNVDPACGHSTTSSIQDGVCLNVPMHKCLASDTQTDASSKHYCYDVLYTEPSQINELIIGNTWARSACCSLAKNGTVLSSFMPHVHEQEQVSTATQVNYTINCYLNDSFSGPALELPTNISRGQDMYCKVSAQTWDPALWLVVPDCRFMARITGSPSYTFVDNKCPTSSEFGMNYYSFDGHNWGFKFRTPQFDGYDDLFLSCECYVCDPTLDKKPYCDRTCRSLESRTRRHMSDRLSHKARLSEVTNGPFRINDSPFGPLLSRAGALMYTDIDDLQSYRRSLNKMEYQHRSNQYNHIGQVESSAAVVRVSLLVLGLLLIHVL